MRLDNNNSSYFPQEGNKSLVRNIQYIIVCTKEEEKIFHLSFDDFIYAFEDLTEK